MIMLSDTRSAPVSAPPQPADDRAVLVLVQDHLVISTFPIAQCRAALELAQVLCRALGQSVQLFRVAPSPASRLQVGMEAPVDDPSWQVLATAHPALPHKVMIDFSDPDFRLQHTDA